MKSAFEMYREEFQGVHYCCYCLETQGDKYHCCQENHFIPFEDLDTEDQMAIVDEEIHWAEIASKQEEIRNGR
jgi:hypothetical protein